uniref:Protein DETOXIFICATION n=1 Tax=Kalanchoe fedtschenkoi TaxID=63787 RepID=A0A7N0T6B9_KALFE
MERNSDVTTALTNRPKIPLLVFFRDARHVLKMDALGLEILKIAFPAALALAADPVASLIDTAFIGRLGSVQLAAVGVSIAIFNQASRITIYPLVSITTSFVAEEDTLDRMSAAEANKGEQLLKNSVGDASVTELMPLGTETIATNYLKQEKDREINKSESKKSLVMPTGSEQLDDLEKSSAEKEMNPENEALESGAEHSNKKSGKRHITSASTAMVFGTFLGLIQAILLIVAAKPLLSVMGVKSVSSVTEICYAPCQYHIIMKPISLEGMKIASQSARNDSPMLPYALKYLTIRSLGAPAVLLSLSLQGIFRGFKDTTTPLYATLAGDVMNIILDPILIFVCHLGVSGAAIAHVVSQYLMFFILLWMLMKQVDIVPPSFKTLQYGKFFSNGIFLMTRVIAVTFCVTLSASLAARMGAVPMAAFQVCLQVWLMSSLLADGLAVAGQAILACGFAAGDLDKVTSTACRVLQMSFVFGLGLTVVVGAGLFFGAPVFSKDPNVLHLIHIAVPFVAGTQTINSISFVFDGVNYGAADFKYSAYSMVIVAICSVASLFYLSRTNGFIGLWIGLTIYMALRTFAGVWRMGTGTGPWRFLRRI